MAQLEDTKRDVQDADNETQRKRAEVKRMANQLDNETRESVAPFVDAIKASATKVVAIRARLDALAPLQHAHDRLTERYNHIKDLKSRQTIRRERLEELGVDIEDVNEVVGDITNIFRRRIVKSIELPHATGRARIDSQSLLPLVDEQHFTQRGGGAAQQCTSPIAWPC
jgi:hypothetical protein